MSEETGSIWDDETWEVACPPSIPLNLWDQVPEEYRREFIIEAAFALRRGIHPIDTFEEMLEEKGIKKQEIIEAIIPIAEEEDDVKPSGKMNFGLVKAPVSKPVETSNVMAPRPAKSIPFSVPANNAASKLWPGRPSEIKGYNSINNGVASVGNLNRNSAGGLALRGKRQTIRDDTGDAC